MRRTKSGHSRISGHAAPAVVVESDKVAAALGLAVTEDKPVVVLLLRSEYHTLLVVKAALVEDLMVKVASRRVVQ
jgi:hypothetical protein